MRLRGWWVLCAAAILFLARCSSSEQKKADDVPPGTEDVATTDGGDDIGPDGAAPADAADLVPEEPGGSPDLPDTQGGEDPSRPPPDVPADPRTPDTPPGDLEDAGLEDGADAWESDTGDAGPEQAADISETGEPADAEPDGLPPPPFQPFGQGEGTCEYQQWPGGSVWVPEKEIAGTLDGSTLHVTLPVRQGPAWPQSAVVQVSVTDIAGKVLSSTGPDAVLLASELTPFEADLDLPVEAGTLAERAGLLLAYQVEHPATPGEWKIAGFRSLLEVLPWYELLLYAPEISLSGEAIQAKVLLRERNTGAPACDKTVQLAVQKPDKTVLQLAGKTDKFGAALFAVPAAPSGGYKLTASFPAGGPDTSAERSCQVVAAYRTLVTTDKPLYQPGQTVHLRALALKPPKMLPAAGEEVTIEVKDAKGNKLLKKVVPASEHGLVDAELPLADMVLLGDYQVTVSVGGHVSARKFTVDRYSLPKFKVEVSLDKSWCVPGGKISGKLAATYMFGEPVSGAKAKIEIVALSDPPKTLSSTLLAADDAGKLSFEVPVPKTTVNSLGQYVTLDLAAKQVEAVFAIIDSAEHKEVATRVLPVSWTAASAHFIPESGSPVAGLDTLFYVYAADPAGKPLSVPYEVKLAGAAPAAFSGHTDENGVGVLDAVPSGNITATVKLLLPDGTAASSTTKLTMAPPGEQLLVRTGKAVYDAGETIHVDVFSPGNGGPVFIDLIRRGQPAKLFTIDMAGGAAA
ncbi:MAG: hypothetical protein FJ098_10350, partial [Deltaproteobacteria bacterium]|nr:hypothetical protein [Deltaproteobacteria bacterium]